MRRSSRKKQFFMINLGLASLMVLLMDRIDFPQAETRPSFYKIHDLGLSKLPNALNDSGQVAGMMDAGKDSVQAFVWSLDAGFEYIADDKSIANGINTLFSYSLKEIVDAIVFLQDLIFHFVYFII